MADEAEVARVNEAWVKRVLDVAMEAAIKKLGEAGGESLEADLIATVSARFSGLGPRALYDLADATVMGFEQAGIVLKLGPSVRLTQEGWKAYRTRVYSTQHPDGTLDAKIL